MIVQICNYLAGSYLLETEPGVWDSIIILDSTLTASSFVKENSNRDLQLIFDDITAAAPKKILPATTHIRQAIQFGLESERILVCCRAGQSRSAAIAFAIAFEAAEELNADDFLDPKRHSPNEHIIELANGVVDRPGLLNSYDQWRLKHRNVRLVDCLDEISDERADLLARGAKDRISNRSQAN